MFNELKLTQSNWGKVPSLLGFSNRVPNLPGLYAFISYKSILGLPTNTNIEYVGMTKNLRKRFKGHNSLYKAHNRELYEIIMKLKNRKKNGYALDFWFLSKYDERSIISELEKNAIFQLNKTQKLTNKILYQRSA
tara:strand:+ start:5000 stop:5404 length:405 start_codon:yes stop_codon:yes gene_type:complete